MSTSITVTCPECGAKLKPKSRASLGKKGNLRVDDKLPNDFVAKVNVDRWSEVLNMLNAGEMPPEREPRPPLVEATQVVEWIEHERLRAEIARNDRRVVLRRMNRHQN